MGENKKEVKARKKAFRKAKHRAIRPWKGLSIVCAILAVIFVPLYSLLNVFDNSLAIFVGGTFWKLKNEDQSAQYFTSDFESTEDMVDYGLQLVQQVEAEGAALLMNENNALPLAEGANVSLFSNSSVNLVYGGTGSGNIDASTADTLKTAMEKTGFNVNETLWNFYESEEMGMYKRGNGGTIATASAVVTEVPWNEYTDEVKDSVTSYGDAAIVTLSRVGGEGADLAYGDVNYLALDDNEKEMLSNVAAMKADGTVSKIIVLINSANTLQLDFLKDNIYNVDACLWIGDVGITGINAVADILAGNVNPSGSLGYKYYETRYEDTVMGTGNAGSYVYSDDVAFPFGYGLSYTDFEYSDMTGVYDAATDSYNFNVTVTNTGDTYSGKETVQIYAQSPYTEYDKENSVEKSAVQLCGFGKTDILAPGESQTLTINVDRADIASYDAYGAKTFLQQKDSQLRMEWMQKVTQSLHSSGQMIH